MLFLCLLSLAFLLSVGSVAAGSGYQAGDDPRYPGGNAEAADTEAITPEPGSFDTAMMAAGKPGLPRRFTWREAAYEVAEVLDTGKEITPDRGDHYVRRHGVVIRTACGLVMKLTGARASRGRAPRWVLRSIEE